jgi:hypothetical protein
MGEFERGVSCDGTVQIVTSFYTFLTAFPYFPQSTIETPLHRGWPESDREYLCKLGKTDVIVDLLAHLPYMDTRDWHVGYDTQPLQYTGDHVTCTFDHGFTPITASLSPQHEKIPEHVVALTYGEKNGSWLLLDTENVKYMQGSMIDLPKIHY